MATDRGCSTFAHLVNFKFTDYGAVDHGSNIFTQKILFHWLQTVDCSSSIFNRKICILVFSSCSGNFLRIIIWYLTLHLSSEIEQAYHSSGFVACRFKAQGGGGGGAYSTIVYTEVQPLTLLNTINNYFFTRKVPLSYTFHWQMVPFHIPCLELCIPFKCCKCTVL